jgi:hypothetical protein
LILHTCTQPLHFSNLMTALMKKTFKSKVDILVLLPVLVVLLVTEVFMIVNKILIGEIVIALLLAFVFYMCINTLYVVTGDDKLKIKSGFLFNQEIYIKSIKKVRPTKDHRTSPALSFDRLEILYNRYGRVVVSPNDKSGFIKELKEVNPRIRIEERV